MARDSAPSDRTGAVGELGRIATVVLATGELQLYHDGEGGFQWIPNYARSLPTLEQQHFNKVADMATVISNPPHYHPAPQDGRPGWMIAHRLATLMGGELVMDEPDEPPPTEQVEY